MPADLMERWWLRVEEQPDGCWIWTGAKWARGYGRFTMPGDQRRVAAHRFGYEQLVGPIPDGLELDHLCRVHSCVNPSHLEPVTHAENSRRGIAAALSGVRERSKTHCPRGHAYDAENTYWRADWAGRNCRACGRENARRYKAEKRRRATSDRPVREAS
jgi:hypothetical protein